MKLQKVYPYHLAIKIYCKLDYKFGYAEQSKFSYTFTNLYASNSRKKIQVIKT